MNLVVACMSCVGGGCVCYIRVDKRRVDKTWPVLPLKKTKTKPSTPFGALVFI